MICAGYLVLSISNIANPLEKQKIPLRLASYLQWLATIENLQYQGSHSYVKYSNHID